MATTFTKLTLTRETSRARFFPLTYWITDLSAVIKTDSMSGSWSFHLKWAWCVPNDHFIPCSSWPFDSVFLKTIWFHGPDEHLTPYFRRSKCGWHSMGHPWSLSLAMHRASSRQGEATCLWTSTSSLRTSSSRTLSPTARTSESFSRLSKVRVSFRSQSMSGLASLLPSKHLLPSVTFCWQISGLFILRDVPT